MNDSKPSYMCALCVNEIKLADSANQPLAAFLYDLIGADREVEFLIFRIISSNDLAIAKYESCAAIGPGLLAGYTFESRVDRLKGIEFEERVILPFAAGKRGEPVGILRDQGVEIIFHRFRRRIAVV
jgi:hypothetical protein